MVQSDDLFLDSLLVGCTFLEICPFLLDCPICWRVILHSILFFFCISEVSVVISPLSFFISLIGSLLFSSWWAWPDVCQFCLFFQKSALGFIDFFNCYFVSFISFMIFLISFLLLTLCCLFFFFCFFQVEGQVVYLRFSCFWGRPVLLWTSFLFCFSLFQLVG